MWNKVQETVKYLQNTGFSKADYAIVLGSGLGDFIDVITVDVQVAYSDIPNFPVSTVKGHSGNLIFGSLGDKKVIVMQGRFHYYEGWTIDEVTFPIRVFKFLGADKMIVSNASGGVNPNYKVGDIMLIKDHINLLPVHPLRGKNDERFGERFVDMHEPYSLEMLSKIETIAKDSNIFVQKGVYAALQGPTFETPAEYKMIRNLGADTVGMSTVPEVIVAKHMQMNCLGISVITDLGIEGKAEPVSHEAVQKAAKKAGSKMSLLVKKFIAAY